MTVGLAFAVLAAVMLWGSRLHAAAISGALGAVLILAALAIPTRLGPAQVSWMKLAALISRITTPIFMGVVYFVVITPIGLLMRVFRSNPLVRRGGRSGYWVERSAERSNLNRQF